MERKVWPSQQLQSQQFPVLPSSTIPEALSLSTSELFQYGTSPASVTLASNSVSTMMTPCNIPSSLQASAIGMPTCLANPPLMASGCSNVSHAVAMQSVGEESPVPSISNNQSMLIPSNMVGQTMVLHTSLTNQSIMLQPGLANSPMPVHPGIGNQTVSFSNPGHMLSQNPIVETNITMTQKILIPNSHATNFLLPDVAVPYSSYNVDIKPDNNSFVTSVASETCRKILEPEFVDCLQPKYEVKLEPVFTSDVNPTQVQLQHPDLRIKFDAHCSSSSNVKFLQQTSHSATSHVLPNISLPGMIFSRKDTISSREGAFNFGCTQLRPSPNVAYPSPCGDSSNSIMLCSEHPVQVSANGNCTKPLAANVGVLQHFIPGVGYSYQQMGHSTSSSQQTIAPNIDSSQLICSSNMAEQVILSVQSSQQVTCSPESSQRGTCNSGLPHNVISSTNLSREVTPITDKLRNFSINTNMSQQVVSSTDSSQLVTNSSEQVMPCTESSQLLAYNVGHTTDLQNMAHFMDVSQQVPSSIASVQQVVSQMMQHVGNSTHSSSQVFSTVEYSEHFAFSTNSVQQLPTSKDTVQFASNESSPEQISPGVDIIHSILPCDIKIKTEPLEPCAEINVADSDLQSPHVVDYLEVKLEPKLEETETVCCDEFMYPYSDHCATPQIKIDPLSTFPSTAASPPATSLVSHNQDVKLRSSEVVDGGVSGLIPNGYNAQIMLLLPPLHLGDGFQNISNSQALAGVPVVIGCPALENPVLPADISTRHDAVPTFGCSANQSPLHVPLPLAVEVAGKIPIPRLKVNKPVPPPKPPIQVPKITKPNPATIPIPAVPTIILPRPDGVADNLEDFQATGTAENSILPEVVHSADSCNGSPETEQLSVSVNGQSDLDGLPKLWVYVPDTRQLEKDNSTPSVQRKSQKKTKEGQKKVLVSGSDPDGSCPQGSSEVASPQGSSEVASPQGSSEVAKPQNSSTLNSSLNEKMVQSMLNAAIDTSLRYLRKRPPPGCEVLSNDKQSMMSVICVDCIAEETGNFKSGYPDQEKAYKCDRCGNPCYQYFFKYRDSQTALSKEGKQTVQDLVRSDSSNAGLPNERGLPNFCRKKSDCYVCNICGSSFKSNMGFHYHYSKHTNVFRYRCEECGKGFHYKANLVKHNKVHTADFKYQCHVCFKKLKYLQTLQQHLKRHAVPKHFICEWCGEGYSYAKSYRHHVRTVHKVLTGKQCETCLRYFENLNSHTCAPFYECDVCGKRFAKRQTLQTHLPTHTNRLKCKCKICHKVYKDIRKLKFHMHSHSSSWSERYPFLCDVCGRGFRVHKSWKIHRKVHLPGKKYRLKFFFSDKMLREQRLQSEKNM